MNASLSLRARLTVWYTVALLVVMTLGGAVILWQQGRIGLFSAELTHVASLPTEGA